MRIILMTLVIIAFFTAQGSCGNKIYTWTDEHGVKQFSDQPPENIENYDTIESPASDGEPQGNGPEEGVRSSYERMINEVERENRQADQQNAQEAKMRQMKEKQKAQEAKDAKIAAEKDRLQKKINNLNNRALSPTFTKGMRDNQIKELQKQIDALE